MNSEYAIRVQDVSKLYKLYDKPSDRFKEALGLTRKKNTMSTMLCSIFPSM